MKIIKTPEDARKYAALCERHSDIATDPELKAALLEVAKEWREHAAALEQQHFPGRRRALIAKLKVETNATPSTKRVNAP